MIDLKYMEIDKATVIGVQIKIIRITRKKYCGRMD